MILVKSAKGQQVLKDRSVPLTSAQRAAFILFDGKRSVDDVVASTAGVGVTRADVDQLLALGLLDQPATPPAAGRSPQQRYAQAYPIATQLTASLGLRGLKLNLAVEAARSYEDLLRVAERIREAVGSEKFAPLKEALRG